MKFARVSMKRFVAYGPVILLAVFFVLLGTADIAGVPKGKTAAGSIRATAFTPWTWGDNADGQLGDGTNTDSYNPLQLSSLTSVAKWAGGGNHSVLLKGDGTVWAWGSNQYGQLGDGTTNDSNSPIQVTGLPTGLVDVAAGQHHSLAVDSTGNVWGWGYNQMGELGDGTWTNRSTPVQALSLGGIAAVSAGHDHSLALASDGTLYAWGINSAGELGDGTNTNRNTPIPVSITTDVTAVSAGGAFSLALKSDGTVWAWGSNAFGQLGDGTYNPSNIPKQVTGLTGITAIAAGADFSMALKSDGTVWAWGDNTYGELGDGTIIERTSPVQVLNLSSISAIAAGFAHGMAIDSDGVLWTWGYNSHGQLGNGNTVSQSTPSIVSALNITNTIAAGWYHSFVMAIGAPCSLTCTASASPTSGTAPLNVSFTATSTPTNCTGTPTYDWDFGDGSAHSSTQNPTHTYSSAGTYNWTMTASVDFQTCTKTGSVTVSAATCTLTCTASASDIASLRTAPYTYFFTANATPSNCIGSVVFDWNFGDGSQHSSAQNTSHSYAQDGTYFWTMTASVDGQTCTRTGTITLGDSCTLACTAHASPESGAAQLDVSFSADATTSNCTGPPTYEWNFGDDSPMSTEQNPNHTYTEAGSYTWVMMASVDDQGCTYAGTITVEEPTCTIACTASASPASGPAPLDVTFSATATPSNCTGSPTFDWDFGDGSAHSNAQSPAHTYPENGTYNWTMTVSVDGQTCVKTGTVIVKDSGADGNVAGTVFIYDGMSRFALNGSSIKSNTVKLLDGQGNVVDTTEADAEGDFTFGNVVPGEYFLVSELVYTDHIPYDAKFQGFGCQAPAGGIIQKKVVSEPAQVTVVSGITVEGDILFPPPIVFLHGIMGCYEMWYSSGGDDLYWDNYARKKGFVTFTPNYGWLGSGVSWESRATEVLNQVSADLDGLALSLHTGSNAAVPYDVIAYDMGGLVVRTMTSGDLNRDPAVVSMRRIFLLGTPNSGTNHTLGGGSENVMGEKTIIRRFNEIYPYFGDHQQSVNVIAGNKDPWQAENSDGVVSLKSAFLVQRMVCGSTFNLEEDSKTGDLGCETYSSYIFDNGNGHIFHYQHSELGSPASTVEILGGKILPSLTLKAKTGGAENAADDDPDSPVGGTIWGTSSFASGTGGGHLDLAGVYANRTQSYDFQVSRTDGMAIIAFATSGAADFSLSDPDGTVVKSTGPGQARFYYATVAPEPGAWQLTVKPDAGGVTFAAISLEDSPFGIAGYVYDRSCNPGDDSHLTAYLVGDPAGVTPGSMQAKVFDSSGAVIDTVYLYDDGNNQDGAAGDGHYGGHFTAPLQAGAYPVLFIENADYLGSPMVRLDFDKLSVVPNASYFTGVLDDAQYDDHSIRFTAGAALPEAGDYVLSGNLYDSAGRFLAHGSTMVHSESTGDTMLPIIFDMSKAHCSQFGSPFQVQNLLLMNGADLSVLDSFDGSVSTNVYASADFDCDPSMLEPGLTTAYTDQAVAGQSLKVFFAGEGFQPGAKMTADAGIAVTSTDVYTSRYLRISIVISPSAPTGNHSFTLTNPDSSRATLENGFEVVSDSPPTIAIQTPTDGTPVQGGLTVSAAASDDIGIEKVEFIVDGSLKSTDTEFPFRWVLSGESLESGVHQVTVRAFDTKEQTTEASVAVWKDPPAVTKIKRKNGKPFRLVIRGTNFRDGLSVYIGGSATPWSNVKYKNSTKLVLKKGKSLKGLFPKGVEVSIRVVNADGTEVTTSYTR